MSDPYWPVMKPRSGEPNAIEEMNARMIAFHPSLHQVRRDTPKLLQDARDVMDKDVSVADLFRRIISLG